MFSEYKNPETKISVNNVLRREQHVSLHLANKGEEIK
jgi:hypothetical protein